MDPIFVWWIGEEEADPELRRARLEKRRRAMYARMEMRRERRARRGGRLFTLF